MNNINWKAFFAAIGFLVIFFGIIFFINNFVLASFIIMFALIIIAIGFGAYVIFDIIFSCEDIDKKIKK